MVKCEIDGKEFANGGVMARHLKKMYSLTYKEYYHKYILKTDDVPKCKCGCGKEMRWTLMGYTEFAKGHYSRIHNNWGHNPKAVAKSSETRRQQYASGERIVWNDGLTKETDERVKNNVISLVAFSKTPEERKVRAERMKKGRLDYFRIAVRILFSALSEKVRTSGYSSWSASVSDSMRSVNSDAMISAITSSVMAH